MNYPKAIKAFYMRVNDHGCTVAAVNVLAPGIGEIIGGSQREERLEVLDQTMTERGIDKHEYTWYRDLRRYGTVPHAGFGLGFERTLAYVTGLANVSADRGGRFIPCGLSGWRHRNARVMPRSTY
jgi:asparaginyl-tRNA synthetase